MSGERLLVGTLIRKSVVDLRLGRWLEKVKVVVAVSLVVVKRD